MDPIPISVPSSHVVTWQDVFTQKGQGVESLSLQDAPEDDIVDDASENVIAPVDEDEEMSDEVQPLPPKQGKGKARATSDDEDDGEVAGKVRR